MPSGTVWGSSTTTSSAPTLPSRSILKRATRGGDLGGYVPRMVKAIGED